MKKLIFFILSYLTFNYHFVFSQTIEGPTSVSPGTYTYSFSGCDLDVNCSFLGWEKSGLGADYTTFSSTETNPTSVTFGDQAESVNIMAFYTIFNVFYSTQIEVLIASKPSPPFINVTKNCFGEIELTPYHEAGSAVKLYWQEDLINEATPKLIQKANTILPKTVTLLAKNDAGWSDPTSYSVTSISGEQLYVESSPVILCNNDNSQYIIDFNNQSFATWRDIPYDANPENPDEYPGDPSTWPVTSDIVDGKFNPYQRPGGTYAYLLWAEQNGCIDYRSIVFEVAGSRDLEDPVIIGPDQIPFGSKVYGLPDDPDYAGATIEWQKCKYNDTGNCSEGDSWNSENWETLDQHKNDPDIIITNDGSEKTYYYRVRISDIHDIDGQTITCSELFSPIKAITFLKFTITGPAYACPGQNLTINITGLDAGNDYSVYACEKDDRGFCAQFKQIIPVSKTDTEFTFDFLDLYPGFTKLFIRDNVNNITTPYYGVGTLPPGTHTATISGGQGIANETCLYTGETLRLTADFCDGMINNPDDWEFVWQERIDDGEFVDMDAYADITQSVHTKDVPHPGNTQKQEHTYRVVVRRVSDHSKIFYLEELDFTFYPLLLKSFSSFTRHCTQLFVPDINEEYTECLPYVYEWDFGDVTSGPEVNDKEPVHKYIDEDITYQVSLTVSYNCGCGNKSETVSGTADFFPPDDLFITQIKDVTGAIVEKTIQASASSLTDVWDLLQIDEKLISENPWQNGLAGIWRQDATFVYKTDRDYLLDANTEIDISQAGTFPLKMFDYDIAPKFEIPGWKEVNTITNYSPYGFQTENQDVLGIYSAALYGTFGDFPLAVGQNTRELEMAYTGFETPESFLDPQNKITKDGATLDMGNWILGQAAPPVYQKHTVLAASENMTLVEGHFEVKPHYWVMGKSLSSGRHFMKKANVHCYKVDGENTVVTFDEWLQKGQWVGYLIYRDNGVPAADVTITDSFAHTGKYSFSITGEKTFRQSLLDLETGKKYFFSAWVSNGDELDTSIEGITIDVLKEDGAPLVQFEKTGTIVNGWQQISGSFIAPQGKIKIQLETTNLGFFDDLRLHPYQGNMKSYVYDMNYYRLLAELDENNYATFYEYDKSGALQVVKKETERGIITVQESITNTPTNQ